MVLVIAGCGQPGAAPSAERIDWRAASLTDARTGETFSIDDLRGKLVAVEPMALWCVNCQFQQREVAAALKLVGQSDLVVLSLDVDPNEQSAALAQYADDQAFSWRFAVASRDLARSLAAAFGDQVLSPPSTPMILIGPDGTIIEQHLGIRGSADLADLFEQHVP
ncbi:MAG: TlpA disulfide reductase family protein [Chloroflexota bacterium]